MKKKLINKNKDKKQKFRSSIYCHSYCRLWKIDGCCAWISFKKKDVKTAEGYENINNNNEFIKKYCYECEFYIPRSKERLEVLCQHKKKYKEEKERMERCIEECDKCMIYNGGGEYK
jgi:hypothetical protein